MERMLRGLPASPGIVAGPVHLLRWEVPDVPPRIVTESEVPQEIERFHDAVSRAQDRLRHVRDRAAHQAGPEESKIFEVQITMLDDRALRQEVEGFIRERRAAEHAFDLVMLEWRRRFGRASAPMLRERVGDLMDLHIRVLGILLALPDHDPVDLPKGSNAILVTHDLTPSLTVQLDRDAIAALATDEGTSTSHVAILARSLGLPAVVGLRDATTRLKGNERAVLDGTTGVLVINPTDEEIAQARLRAEAAAILEESLRSQSAVAAQLRSGERIFLRANVDIPEESELAARSGADGVGLMRTEFVVIGRAAMPDEEEQYRAYRRVVDAFPGKPVVIRTFDIGGDKLPVGGFPTEANPFLGWRAIRMCLDQPELFLVQLRALLRAAAHGDVRILLPLVVSVDEVRRTRALIAEAARMLNERGAVFRERVLVGVMIETPAAAVAADTFVQDADFFSIGTNDLVQYTLAVDRGNVNLAARFTPLHPAVLRLIRQTVEAGRRGGIEVAVCGEMGSHPLTAFVLVGLGIRYLSVAPRAVPFMKRVLRSISAEAATEAAEAALASATAAEAERIVRRLLQAAATDLSPAELGLLGSETGDILGYAV
jgi:phosphoenolpyruvate-protein phosphotransferase (PTS system enzyme I)